jgi:RNA polymerase sigma factor (sigma-70 family)
VDDYYRVRAREWDLDDADCAGTSTVQLDSALDKRRLRQRISDIVDHLPEQYRILLKWRYWDQRSTADIAEAVGRTPKAVERMLARARERFRCEWEARP